MVDWNLRSYTEDEFKSAWNNSNSIRECAIKLNLANNGGTNKSLKAAAESLGLTRDHMKLVVSKNNNSISIPLEQILVENSHYSTSNLRVRLLKEGLLEAKCSAPYCPNPEEYPNPFTGEMVPQKLTLDHINGVNTDNRIENLRILCYNCHALTDTFCTGNSRQKKKILCACGKEKDKKAMQCIDCRKAKPTKLSIYEDQYLIEGVINLGWSEFSRRLNVSDNGLRKEFDRRNIERPKIKRGPKILRASTGSRTPIN